MDASDLHDTLNALAIPETLVKIATSLGAIDDALNRIAEALEEQTDQARRI